MKCESVKMQMQLPLEGLEAKAPAMRSSLLRVSMAGKAVVLGAKYGMLTVIEQVGSEPQYKARWLCRCDCGNRTQVPTSNLLSGHTKSCGCYRRKWTALHQQKHGHSFVGRVSKEYRTWQFMRDRCTNPKNKSYGDYGGRGISVCEAWNDFKAFFRDMGPKPAGTSIDRIKNDKGYEPGNCRWATRAVQNSNTRQNKFITINGVTKTHADWEREKGLRPGRIYARLSRGWSEEKAVLTPNAAR